MTSRDGGSEEPDSEEADGRKWGSGETNVDESRVDEEGTENAETGSDAGVNEEAIRNDLVIEELRPNDGFAEKRDGNVDGKLNNDGDRASDEVGGETATEEELVKEEELATEEETAFDRTIDEPGSPSLENAFFVLLGALTTIGVIVWTFGLI